MTPQAPFSSTRNLEQHLRMFGIECETLDDEHIRLPFPQSDLVAVLRLEANWLMFRLHLREDVQDFSWDAFSRLLMLNDRILGFRFCVEGDDLYAFQDFPLSILNDRLDVYILHLFEVLDTIVPKLEAFLDAPCVGEREIDGLFDGLTVGDWRDS